MIEDDKKRKLLKQMSILYVEDEKDIRENLSITLGYIFKEVITAADANSAILQFREKNPDMILSDINLPGMSGIELIENIRKENENIPCILLSAYTQTKFLLSAIKLKLVNYLVKPVTFEELYKEFENALDTIIGKEHKIIYLNNGMRFDLEAKVITFENNIIKLTKHELKFIEVLASLKNSRITIEELKYDVWDEDVDVSDAAFKSVLNKLRNKIGKDSIINVSGCGYYLNCK